MSAFATTRWSLVAQAGLAEEEARQRALENLIQSYWQPVYEFVWRSGFDPETSKDLTQAFFAKILEKNSLVRADRELGRFRTFLLTILKNFISDWREHGQREKRGGGAIHLSLDDLDFSSLSTSEIAPDLAFDRRWAITLMERATNSLRAEANAAGRGDLFEALVPQLGSRPEEVSYEQIASDFGMSRNTVAMANRRLRLRFRELIRLEIAETLDNAADIDEELAALREALSASITSW